MKIKKVYSFKSKRQIWRIIPTETDKLVIEERETEKKQVYFNCLQLESGKKNFKDFQLDEKFWVGIESVYNNIIFFHKYLKPDMPGHKGIFAYDCADKTFKWEHKNLTFLFPINDLIYSYAQKFEGRIHYSLDYKTGEIVEDLGSDSSKINELREQYIDNENSKDYHFPKIYFDDNNANGELNSFFQKLKNEFVISGKLEFIHINSLLLFCFHGVNSRDSMDIFFKAVDLSTGKYILEEILSKETKLFISDSFFIKGDLLFVLFGKSKLVVYNIKN
jgi:hypothetical protein